ncbi:MAG: hypothetical protein RR552_07220 [Oscillospiraceae bacterium]
MKIVFSGSKVRTIRIHTGLLFNIVSFSIIKAILTHYAAQFKYVKYKNFKKIKKSLLSFSKKNKNFVLVQINSKNSANIKIML